MGKATHGQSNEFIGKLLVKLSDEKIAQIDKQKIQKVIDSLTSKDDTVIDNFIRFINNGCRLQIIGNHEIDTNRIPNLPFDGATTESHGKSGKMVLDFSKLDFYLADEQKNGSIIGHELRKKLKNKSVMNACVLDHLLENPQLIPEEWKKDANGNTRYIFFWGTIFRDSDGDLYVRYLCWSGGEWCSSCGWLDGGFVSRFPALVSAN